MTLLPDPRVPTPDPRVQGPRAPAWRGAVVASLREAGWAPALVFVLHVVAARGFAAYALFPPLDIPMHFLGGVAITFFIGHSYRVAERSGLLGRPGRWLYFVLVPAFAISTTVLWEFAEFLSDRYFGTHAQLGLEDTLSDMALGCLGSVVFLVMSAVWMPSAAAAKHGDV